MRDKLTSQFGCAFLMAVLCFSSCDCGGNDNNQNNLNNQNNVNNSNNLNNQNNQNNLTDVGTGDTGGRV